MSTLNPLLSGLVFPESPRWHDDRLWLADWGAHEVIAVDRDGKSEVVAEVASFPFSIDWLPDGRFLAVSAADRRLLRRDGDGPLVTHAELGNVSERPWNEIVVDGRGNVYVNNIGFNFPGEDFAPGLIALVRPDGSVRKVADDVAFPNGMAVTGDNSTLVLAESYGNILTAFDIAAERHSVQPATLGRPGRGRTGRHLPGCGGSRLVRGRASPILRPRARRGRGPTNDQARPRLLRLHAGWG